jgi:hypothetical protein
VRKGEHRRRSGCATKAKSEDILPAQTESRFGDPIQRQRRKRGQQERYRRMTQTSKHQAPLHGGFYASASHENQRSIASGWNHLPRSVPEHHFRRRVDRTRRTEEQAVQTNTLATYLGCLGLVIGGAGLTYRAISADNPNNSATAPSPLVQASQFPSSPSSAWPPEGGAGAVAFYDEWMQLLAPKPQPAAAPNDVTVGAANDAPQAPPARTTRTGDAQDDTRQSTGDRARYNNSDRRRGTDSRMDRRRAPPPDIAEDDEVRDPREAYGRNEERYRDRQGRDGRSKRERDWGERDTDVIIERRPAPVPFFGIFGR